MNDIILFAAIFMVYGLLESLWNVSLFRPTRTWFPFWDIVEQYRKTKTVEITYAGNAYGFEMSGSILDPFHMIKATLSILTLTFISWFMIPGVWSWYFPFFLCVPIGIWLVYYGILFPWLYHEFWMTKGNRDLNKQSAVWKIIYFWRM